MTNEQSADEAAQPARAGAAAVSGGEISATEERELTVLTQELSDYGNAVRSGTQSANRFLVWPLIVLSGAAAYVGKRGFALELLVVAPVALGFFAIYAVNAYSELFSMGAYKAFLEQRVNQLIGYEPPRMGPLMWERTIAKLRQKSLSGIAITVAFVVVTGASGIGGIAAARILRSRHLIECPRLPVKLLCGRVDVAGWSGRSVDAIFRGYVVIAILIPLVALGVFLREQLKADRKAWDVMEPVAKQLSITRGDTASNGSPGAKRRAELS